MTGEMMSKAGILPSRDIRCTATSQRSGERCQAFRMKGWDVCRFHGANSHPDGKGVWPISAQDLTKEEEKSVIALYNHLLDSEMFKIVPLENIEEVILRTACVHLIKSYRGASDSHFADRYRIAQYNQFTREANKIISRRLGTKISQDIRHSGKQVVEHKISLTDMAEEYFDKKRVKVIDVKVEDVD